MRSAIKQREYELQNSNINQQKGDVNALLQDAGLQETLNMAK